MPGFFYFLPGAAQRIDLAQALSTPLRATLLDLRTNPACRASTKGPEDCGSGCVISTTLSEEVELGYFPEKQIWQKIPGEEVWVGYYVETPPKEKDLQRGHMLGGHMVTLGDEEQDWLVPCARRFHFEGANTPVCYNALPCRDVLQSDGSWSPTEPRKRYQLLWDIAEKYWTVYALGGSVTYDDVRNWAVIALQTNYRVGPVEVSMLGLLDSVTCPAIMQAVCDIPGFEEYMAKKNTQRNT